MSYLSVDPDEIRDFLESSVEDILDVDLDKLVATKTKEGRDAALQRWYRFWETQRTINADQIWVDLCGSGPARERAVALCKKYLWITATRTVRSRPTLGPEEKEAVRVFKQASSLVSLWKATVMAFNRTVLAQKRRESPSDAERWNLKFGTGIQVSRGTGPVSEIIEWIGARAKDMGLSLEQSFVKKEATTDDVALLLQVLWRRADLIRCEPLTRTSFHFMVLLGSLGGFRPDAITNFKFRHVCVELIRMPGTEQRRLVATFTIHQNKQRIGLVKSDQRNVLQFSVVMHPYSLFCPVSLVIARALTADAFRHGFRSLDELVNRPVFDGEVCSILLPWREELLDQDMFPITYHRFWSVWRRTNTVAGYPEELRPYAMRVGAGRRLDRTLTPALRNYLLSHTSGIFAKSYQARHVEENLIPILAPEANAEDNEEVFGLLRRSSLRCDELAPTDASREDVAQWDQRADLAALYGGNDAGKHDKIRSIRLTLRRLATEDRRRQYFEESNSRRALGQARDHAPGAASRSSEPVSRVSHATSLTGQISCLLKHDSDAGRSRSQEAAYVDKLTKYLDDAQYGPPTCLLCQATFPEWDGVWKHSNVAHGNEQPIWPLSCPDPACCRPGGTATARKLRNLGEWSAHVHENHAPWSREPLRCVMGCRTFRRRRDLITHLEKDHAEPGVDSEPFPCPECQRLDVGVHTFVDLAQFWQHVESCHGARHVPPRAPTTSHECLLCSETFGARSALARHTTAVHEKDEQKFADAFSCPECDRMGMDECKISGRADWFKHVAEHHGRADAPAPTALTLTKCLLCYASVFNLKSHFLRKHLDKGQLDPPFPCPECARQGAEAVVIESYDNWRLHCATIHSFIAPPLPTTEKVSRKRERCLICDKHFVNLGRHIARSHVGSGYFGKPFQCPECARAEATGSIPWIEDQQAWLAHCASAHESISSGATLGSMDNDRHSATLDEKLHVEEAQVGPEAGDELGGGCRRLLPTSTTTRPKLKRSRTEADDEPDFQLVASHASKVRKVT